MGRPVRRADDDDPVERSAPRRPQAQGFRWWITWLKDILFDPYSVKKAKEAHLRRELLAQTHQESDGEDSRLARLSDEQLVHRAGEPEPVICAQVTPWGLIYLGVWGQPLHPNQAADRLGWELEHFLEDAQLGPDGEIELPEDP